MIAFDPKNIKVTFAWTFESENHENRLEIVEEWLNNTLYQRLSWLEEETGDLELENVETGEELEIQFAASIKEDPPKIKVNYNQNISNVKKSQTYSLRIL